MLSVSSGAERLTVHFEYSEESEEGIMSKCPDCGRRFFFKKFIDGRCPDCAKFASEQQRRTDLLDDLNKRIEDASTRLEKLAASVRKSEKAKEAFKSIQYATEQFNSWEYRGEQLLANAGIDPDSFSPIAPADLMCMQIKELRSRYRKKKRLKNSLMHTSQDTPQRQMQRSIS